MNSDHIQAIGANRFNLLRLLAAVQVLLVHSLNHLNYAGPFVAIVKGIPGVPVFFFISGLLISHAYMRTQPLGLNAFFRNRALRIFPALWAIVLLSAAMLFAVGFFPWSFLFSPRFILWMAAQSSIIQFYNPDFLRSFGVGVLNGSLWTISVELQFYVLTPLLVFLLKGKPAAFFFLFFFSIGTNFWMRIEPSGPPLLQSLLYVSFLPWVYMFMSGMLAAIHLHRIKHLLAHLPLVILLVLYAVAMLGIGNYTDNASNAIHFLAFGLLGLIVLKVAFPSTIRGGPLATFIQRNDLSYGIYLVHMPLINLLLHVGWSPAGWDIVVVAGVSLLLAIGSWFIIERPALRHKI